MSLKSQPRQKHKQTLLTGSSLSCATAICVYTLWSRTERLWGSGGHTGLVCLAIGNITSKGGEEGWRRFWQVGGGGGRMPKWNPGSINNVSYD